MVKSYSFNPVSGKVKHVTHSEPITIKIFSPKRVPLRSHRSSFIDSFSFGKKRCNTLQSFGAFFAQSCDRFLFPFSLFSHFFSFFIYFITITVVEFLIKQLFYSGLLDIE